MKFQGLASNTTPFECAPILIKVHPHQVVVIRLSVLQLDGAKFRAINRRNGYFQAGIINFDIN